ncbi:HD domain-containing protein [Granulicoccus phenolivorans]|uniref:[protein-PII] uridylyltransferase family protein n=1 Tax=Granulicoccus phenolivorans TaxID=266854 RepID=UPI00040CB3A3|nr:HD domain-containing protein [Granulicoccus phenolivorans]
MFDTPAVRLAAAGDRDFTDPAAGPAARAAAAQQTLARLTEHWRSIDVPKRGVALACTGSLARREPGPLSDLDLVVLHDKSLRPAVVHAIAEQLWYPIWDSGVALDHAVRSVAECREVANADLSVAGAMLDLSAIVGDEALVAQAGKVLAEDWRANTRRRLPEVEAAVAERHERFGDMAQLLEPDLKEAKGGLRDMSVLRTLTASWLADRPHGAVDAAYQQLLDLRDGLQIESHRPRNLLTMADQDGLAERFHVADADELLARTARISRIIASALDDTLRRARQSQRARFRNGPRRPDLRLLRTGLYANDGELVLGRGAEPGPLLPLRAAATAADQNLPLSPTTARKLGELPAPQRPWTPRARALFVDMLAGTGLQVVWNALDLTGVVTGWIPQWEAIRDRPQRNALHRHTVDRHSIQTVLETHRLLDTVDRPDLLLVAALLHDIGKARGRGSELDPAAGGHSAIGAALTATIAPDLGFDDADTERLVLLVREHLTLMEFATGRDIADPATTDELARRLGRRESNLDLLAALTEADARAAGPRAWSSGRAALMRELVERTRAQLHGAGHRLSDEDHAEEAG